MTATRILLCTLLALFVAALPATAQCDIDKLTANDGDSNDEFAGAVAVDGDVLVVGTPVDESSGQGSGSAYVMREISGNFAHEQKLVPSDGATGATFGFSVDCDGDVIVVGAPLDDEAGLDAGAVYVFRWNGVDTWVEEAKLLSGDREPLDEFGHSVAVSGDLIAVGAWHDVDEGINSGSAHVYRYDTGVWSHEAKLIGSDVTIEDKFGEALDLDGDLLAVGARGDDEVATTAGTVYIYRDTGGTWPEETKLLAADGQAFDRLGQSVAVQGNVVLAGAYFDDDQGSQSGSAYVFRWNGVDTWTEEDKLLSDDGVAGDRFGFSAALDGTLAVIGARSANAGAVASGAAYVFSESGGVWSQVVKLAANDPDDSDDFGASVGLSGTTAVSGAAQDDDLGINSGSAYVFPNVDTCSAWTIVGRGLGGSAGTPTLRGLGPLVDLAPVEFVLNDVAPFSSAFFVFGTSQIAAAFKSGVLVPAPEILIGPLDTGSGRVVIQSTAPAGLPAGIEIVLQAWVVDRLGPAGFSSSPGLTTTTP